MSHTEGKLQLVTRNVGIADTGDYDGVCEAKSASGKIIFQIWGGDDIDEANARRLVACWNALLPFTTEQIENGIDLTKLMQERDELVKAAEEAHRELCILSGSHNKAAMSLRAELGKKS